MPSTNQRGTPCPHIDNCVGLMALSIMSGNQVTETPYCQEAYHFCPLYKLGMVDGMPAFASIAKEEVPPRAATS